MTLIVGPVTTLFKFCLKIIFNSLTANGLLGKTVRMAFDYKHKSKPQSKEKGQRDRTEHSIAPIIRNNFIKHPSFWEILLLLTKKKNTHINQISKGCICDSKNYLVLMNITPIVCVVLLK